METTDDLKGKWEKRWHPLRREWIVYAAHRNNRPWQFEPFVPKDGVPPYDPHCHLCPGNRRISGVCNPDYSGVHIFDNDHPVVGEHSPMIDAWESELHDGLYKRSRAGGVAKVVCFDPRHHVTLSDVTHEQATAVFKALRDQMQAFILHEGVKSVLIFENKGEMVGVSNPHPHCQIYAVDFTFNLVQKELQAMQLYKSEKSRNIFEDIISAELKDGIRIVAENEHTIAFIPHFARFAYETYVFPKKRHATLATMDDAELAGMAEVFQTLTRKFDANFGISFPYVMAMAQAPVDGGNYDGYHMHLIFCPPLRQPGLPKFLAGPETGGDTFMADTMPEEKAAELRAINLPPIA